MRIWLLLCVFFAFSCKEVSKKDKLPVDLSIGTSESTSALKDKLGNELMVSVHRGGVGLSGYPENCLETIKYVNDSIKAIYEIDVAKTKDDVLVLMHDNTIDRTTTGEGKLTNYNYADLQKFYLQDDFGKVTSYKTPKFQDVLLWAVTNKVILSVDVKRSVNLSEVIKVIRNTQAENVVMIITYATKQAEEAYRLAPDMLLSVSARNMQEFKWLQETQIPVQNMVAFTGTKLSDYLLYKTLHTHGIKTMLGTLGNLDKMAKANSDSLYISWKNKGIDIFATDRPFAVAEVLKTLKK